MKTDFNVNDYWLERGRTYMQETRTPESFHRLQERFLLDVLLQGNVPMHRVLEIGCGFGRITKLLAQTWPDAEITALDLSPEQLANAQRYCDGNPRIHFQQYDFYSGAPLPGGGYDSVVAIEVFLHHPPEFVAALFKRLAGAAQQIVSIDWSEDWSSPLPEHVWLHDYPKLFAEAGLQAATFALPAKVDGKQQKLFVAARNPSPELLTVEKHFREQLRDGPPPRAAKADDWTRKLQLATAELLGIVPPGTNLILVDDAQWGNVRALGSFGVFPFLERDGTWWGPPADDEIAWQELERLRQEGASHIVFAWPSFWWFEHYAGFTKVLRETYPTVLENERLVILQLES